MNVAPDTSSDASVRSGDEASRAKLRDLRSHVAEQVDRLQAGYLRDDSSAVAALAKLRRGVGRQPGELVELLRWTSAGLWSGELPDDEPSDEERASHIAITLYAVHQQGHRTERMHRAGGSLGAASRRLREALHSGAGDGADRGKDPVERRFDAVATATGLTEAVRHAGGLIRQFRGAAIPLDYGLFADDLRKLIDPERADSVRLRWGRDFYRPQRRPGADGGETTVETEGVDTA